MAVDRPLSEALVSFTLLAFAAFIAMAAYSWHESWLHFSAQCSLSSYAERISLAIYSIALEANLSSHNASTLVAFKDHLTIRGEHDHFTVLCRGYSVDVFLENFTFLGVASGYCVNITCTPSLKVVFTGGFNGGGP
ncbi:MAG: hypothetical protein J7L98_05320 [Candidatus Verstraetearchaeota archaeon]|nr:hypothetical protein [Candidatus Verstraetearchaeota archaeon]